MALCAFLFNTGEADPRPDASEEGRERMAREAPLYKTVYRCRYKKMGYRYYRSCEHVKERVWRYRNCRMVWVGRGKMQRKCDKY